MEAEAKVGITEYIDSKNNIHSLKHSVNIDERERKEIEERIAEELYRIFSNNIK